MRFNKAGGLLLGIFMISSRALAGPDPYWDYMALAATGHPMYKVFISGKESAASLMAIERARRYPRVEGVLSRLDGASTLTTTPSAWQTGLALTYPILDNRRQDARDEIARSQGQQEVSSSAQNIERLMLDLANTHIRIWEARESIQILEKAGRHLGALQIRLAEQAKRGEVSLLLQSRFTKMGLDIQTKLLDARQRLDSASKAWLSTGSTPSQAALLPNTSAVSAPRSGHATLQRLEAELSRAQGEYDLAKRDEGLAINLQAWTLVRKYESQPDWPQFHIWQVNATYPFFDGGLSKSRTQREALKLENKRAELTAERIQTDTELERLGTWLLSMYEIIKSLQEQCGVQTQIAESMVTRFELGRGSLSEVVESYLAANDCTLTVVKNRAEYFTRYHDLSRLNGTLARLVLGEK